MAPWDSKFRWKIGGNLERVRLICEFNWQECPLAVANYVWSEFVTDVVECMTNEGTLLRLIILILACMILFLTIWSRAQWITANSIISKDNLNRIDYKVQDLELRVNVLTYKMEYGTWPLLQQITDGTNIDKDLKDNVKLRLSNSSSRNSWSNHHISRHYYTSKSENLGLRLRKPKALVETSKKIYYNRPNGIYEMRISNSSSSGISLLKNREKFDKFDKIVNKQSKKYTEPPIIKDKIGYCCTATREVQDSMRKIKMRKSIMNKYGKKKLTLKSEYNLDTSNKEHVSYESIYNNVPANMTPTNKDPGQITNPLSEFSPNEIPPKISRKSPPQSALSTKKSNNCHSPSSTHETLANVAECLENLHTTLKSYRSQQNLFNSTKKENVEEESTKTFIFRDSDEIHTEIANVINIIAPQPIELNIESDKNEQIDIRKTTTDEEKEIQVTKENEEIQSPILPIKKDTDENSYLSSSQLDLSYDDTDINTENISPDIKSFCQSKLLDIISEEQSGSSSTEKPNETIVHPKMLLEKNIPFQNSSFSSDTNNCLVHINTEQRRAANNEESKCDLQSNKNIQEWSESLEEVENKTESDDSDGIIVKSTTSSQNKLMEDNDCTEEATFSNHIDDHVDNFLDMQNDEQQLIDISNFTLKRRPEVFSFGESSDSKFDIDSIKNPNHDLIDFNFEDDEKMMIKTDDIICNNESDTPFSLVDDNITICDNNLNSNDTESWNDNTLLLQPSLTGAIVTCPEKFDNNGKSDTDSNRYQDENIHQDKETLHMNLCKNTDSRNLIELERIAYEELTQVENSWNSNEWTLKNSCDELLSIMTDAETLKEENDFQSCSKKSSPCILLSSSSSIYLTVQDGFFSDHLSSSSSSLTINTSNHCVETIENIEMPDSVVNINKLDDEQIIITTESTNDWTMRGNENETEDFTIQISNEDESAKTPRQLSSIVSILNNTTVATNSNEKIVNPEISSIGSNTTEMSLYIDANTHNLMLCSSDISLSLDRSNELIGQPLIDKVMKAVTSSISPSKKSLTDTSGNSIKEISKKIITKKKKSDTVNKIKINKNPNISMVKAKSNSNLIRENSMSLQSQKSDLNNCVNYIGQQRRSKSYIIPRKNKIAPNKSLSPQDSNKIECQHSTAKLKNCEMNSKASSRSSLIDRSNSKVKFDRTNSLSKSHESVNKPKSKSCIPILKTRLDTTKNIDCRPAHSPLHDGGVGGVAELSSLLPPAIFNAEVEQESAKKNIERSSLIIHKNDCGNDDNETKICDERINDKQTVIYVNIITDHDNCVVTKVDTEKFPECGKDKELIVREILNENFHNDECKNNEKKNDNTKFLAVISSTGRNPMSILHQREIEVLVKPSVTDISTSISSDFCEN